MCAGPWHSVRWEHAGPDGEVVPFAWHARASLAGQLDRDADELRQVTEDCYDEYLRMFSEPFAFGSFDQVFVPGLNWGALENPGCVTYRDEILPVGTPTEGERRRRGSVIAHEMAHQWFGNLSTMTWWEDTWLQESFADYMGYRVSEVAGFAGAFVDFSISAKPRAYAADERRSSHPVAPEPEDVGDVDEAFNNFDAISYAKGNSAIQQLVTWLGDEHFLAGVNAYFARHRFGNATLTDFVDALDGATDRDVRGWVEAWLRTTGFDTVRVTRDEDGMVLSREGTRPHRLSVTTYDADLVATGTTMVDLADEPVRLPAAAVVVPNAGNETFARLRLDEDSWAALVHDLASIAEDATRAVVWATAMDLVRCGELAPDEFLGLVTRHVPRERSVAILESVLGWVRRTLVAQHLSPDAVPDAVAQVAAACETGLAAGPDEPIAVALTHTLAVSSPDALLLGQWLVDRETHTGLPVEPDLRWRTIRRLASLGELTVEEIDEERVGDGTIVGVLGAAGARAALPTEAAKAAAWDRLLGDDTLSNREFEAVSSGFWDPEQTALVHPYLPRYLGEGLADGAPPRAELRGAARQVVPAGAVHRRARRSAGRDAAGRRPDRAAAGVGGRVRRPGARAIDPDRLSGTTVRRARRTSR